MSELKYKILYIDDEPNNLSTFRATFRWDYEIFIAKSAFEGFDILAEEEIHLIISDQRMAELSGIEFFKRIINKHPDPCRIILTGYCDLNVINRAINECIIHKFMTKPWDEPSMKQTIEKALEVYQLRKNKEGIILQLESTNKEGEREISFKNNEQRMDFFNSIKKTGHQVFQKKNRI